jgi:hypothetical protein
MLVHNTAKVESLCLQNGLRGPIDVIRAAKHCKLAADQDHAAAQNNYRYYRQHSMVVEMNLVNAQKYYELAADQNLPDAQNNDGYCLEMGVGIEIDFIHAAKYYKLVADRGFACVPIHTQNLPLLSESYRINVHLIFTDRWMKRVVHRLAFLRPFASQNFTIPFKSRPGHAPRLLLFDPTYAAFISPVVFARPLFLQIIQILTYLWFARFRPIGRL